jgi:hypothetical protein
LSEPGIDFAGSFPNSEEGAHGVEEECFDVIHAASVS